MLKVASIQQAEQLIQENFGHIRTPAESVPLDKANSRVLYGDIVSDEDIPIFHRSTVDGYALRAGDTFGCSDSIPAILQLVGKVDMGRQPGFALQPGQCAYVPTGGQLPEGGEAMAMVEHTEDYGDGSIGVLKPVAPGQNCIFRGEEVRRGQVVLPGGKLLQPHDIGALAGMGKPMVDVAQQPAVGIISSGDELVPIEDKPSPGQIRDVNTHTLAAAINCAGGSAVSMGICPDDDERLEHALAQAAESCNMVLLSGGTSVGLKDTAPQLIAKLGKVHMHGLAAKPGKPTIIGEIGGKPVFGLPGNPVAAYFITLQLVLPLVGSMLGDTGGFMRGVTAVIDSNIPSNHGREEFVPVRLTRRDGGFTAEYLPIKSGLISMLCCADGYIRIPRGTEGILRGQTVHVIPFA